MKLRDRGWLWEGQGVYFGVPPSIYGLGQGADYFGLARVNYMFHPNDEHALGLLARFDEVTCDISKWEFATAQDKSVRCVANGDPAVVRAEAEKVARLAKQKRFANVTGAFDDDLMGLMKRHGFGPDEFGEIRAAIRRINPSLKLWSVVYTHEFGEPDFWRAMAPHVDVISLWVWESKDLVHLNEYVDQCRRLFPEKPIVMGVYLRDYHVAAPVPVDLVRAHMQRIADLIDRDWLAGYSIIASVLIDGHRAQADAVRDFIADH